MNSFFNLKNLGFCSKFLLCLTPIYTLLIVLRFSLFDLPLYENPIYSSTLSLLDLTFPLVVLNFINIFISLPLLNLLRRLAPRVLFFSNLSTIKIACVNNFTIITFLSIVVYPLYAIVYATDFPLLSLILFSNRVFSASWFLLFFTNFRCQVIAFSFYIFSLPYCFISGNRTAILFPPLLFLLAFFASSIPSILRRIMSFRLNLRFIISIVLVVPLLVYSFSARLNRISTSNDIIGILSEDSFRQAFLSATFDRLIPWHLFSTLLSSSFLQFENIFLDFSIHFSDRVNDLEYLIEKGVYLGMFNGFGWTPAVGYTIPSTFFIQGASRFSYIGFLIYSILFCILLILTSRFLRSCNFPTYLIFSYLLSFVLVGHFSEPIGQLFKTSIQICFLCFALFISFKLLPSRL